MNSEIICTIFMRISKSIVLLDYVVYHNMNFCNLIYVKSFILMITKLKILSDILTREQIDGINKTYY